MQLQMVASDFRDRPSLGIPRKCCVGGDADGSHEAPGMRPATMFET